MLHRQTVAMREPVWATYTDGDLWRALWHLMQRKGPYAVRFTKVKGHAGAKELRAGTVNLFDVAGNNRSDTLATRGRVERSDQLGQIANFFFGRQNAYVLFVTKLHSFRI
jgi:ribonuclease HI